MSARADLPTLTIGTDDYNPLMYAATIALHQGHPHADFLITELRRANICRPDELPEDVVSMGARVTYRLNRGVGSVTRTLGALADSTRLQGEVSVLSPLGIALLGLRVGDRMPFRAGKDGPLSEVIIEDVGFRPLADMAPYEDAAHGVRFREAHRGQHGARADALLVSPRVRTRPIRSLALQHRKRKR